MKEATTALSSPLRPYQLVAARAIVESVARRRGLSFSVEIARQGGKNELSARVELYLLSRYFDQNVTSIKAAPTFKPQARISFDRLWDRLEDAGLSDWAVKEQGNAIRLGKARQLFLSAHPSSNVVGHTADLLLEIDEAQEVDAEKFEKEFQPMAANRGATTVFYGTAWDDVNLLERAKQAHLEQERLDGIRRHFEFDWQVVAQSNPHYARFVAGRRDKLGADHPLFLTQYCLRPTPGAGRLFGPTQLSLLRGSHSWLDSPVRGETYVAGLDLAGEAVEPAGEAGHDESVLTIARLVMPGSLEEETSMEVVRHYAWRGVAHRVLLGALLSLLAETWRVRRLAVDSTGVGETIASTLKNRLGASRVETVKFTAETKSRLGYALIGAVNAGRLRLYEAPVTGEGVECWRQLERCRAVVRANETLSFFVEASDGHDDHVISLALVVAAAADAAPRTARGRQREVDLVLGEREWQSQTRLGGPSA